MSRQISEEEGAPNTSHYFCNSQPSAYPTRCNVQVFYDEYSCGDSSAETTRTSENGQAPEGYKVVHGYDVYTQQVESPQHCYCYPQQAYYRQNNNQQATYVPSQAANYPNSFQYGRSQNCQNYCHPRCLNGRNFCYMRQQQAQSNSDRMYTNFCKFEKTYQKKVYQNGVFKEERAMTQQEGPTICKQEEEEEVIVETTKPFHQRNCDSRQVFLCSTKSDEDLAETTKPCSPRSSVSQRTFLGSSNSDEVLAETTKPLSPRISESRETYLCSATSQEKCADESEPKKEKECSAEIKMFEEIFKTFLVAFNAQMEKSKSEKGLNTLSALWKKYLLKDVVFKDKSTNTCSDHEVEEPKDLNGAFVEDDNEEDFSKEKVGDINISRSEDFTDKKIEMETVSIESMKLVMCPHCFRKFSTIVAERHINICRKFEGFKDKLHSENRASK